MLKGIPQKLGLLLLLLIFQGQSMIAQVDIDVNFDVNHEVGEVVEFDRSKFIIAHTGSFENDWIGELDNLNYLINDLDVYTGRETGSMKYELSLLNEDPNRPGFADPDQMLANGTLSKNNYSLFSTERHLFEKGDVVMAAQDSPFYPNGHNQAGKGWYFSQNDTSSEPFGTALGEYMGRYLRDYFGTGGATGMPKPKYVEVMNEPVWPLVEYNLHGGATIPNIFKMHTSVADQIHNLSPDTKVGGFTTAFPDLEKNNFGQWDERWKTFIDQVGSKMDFYSIHLYDFPGISGGLEQYRKGSNMEATMDMIEHYNTIKYGEAKPWLISEYGSQLNDWFDQPWSKYRDWLCLKAFSSMMMQFMERPNTIIKAIPFSLAKAEWGRNAPNVPYYWRLMRQANEPASATGEWVWSEQIKFYELWSKVKGLRVDTKASDIDVQVDAYVDGNKAYVILNNIDSGAHTINLNNFGADGNNITNIEIKKLYLASDDTPRLTTENMTTVPNSIVVEKDATVIIQYTFDQDVTVNNTSKETKLYATTYKQAILAGQAVSFNINGVVKASYGEATLRLGVGREKNKSRQPIVMVNGETIAVPADYRGDDQQDRNGFFGVLEIPVPYAELNANNVVTVQFPDAGGYISSVALQAYAFSRDIPRSGVVSIADSIDCTSLPSSVVGATSITVDVAYSAAATRDIVVEFKEFASGTWLGQGTTTVNAGSGVASVTINLQNAPANGNDYRFVGSVRPQGGDWTTNIKVCLTDKVTLTDPAPTVGADTVDCTSMPTSVISETAITVDVAYTATTARDVVVELKEYTSGKWLGQGTTTVSGGSGVASVTINLANAPANSNDYRFATSIRPLGGDWTTNIQVCLTNQITVGSPTPVIEADTIDCNSLPTSVISGTAITVDVAYTATTARDVVVELKEYASEKWLGQGTTTVSSGSGVASVTIYLTNAPANSNDYRFATSIRPLGGDWTTNIQVCLTNQITVTSNVPTIDSVDCTVLPATVGGGNSITVAVGYGATTTRDIVVELKEFASGKWLGQGTTTVSAGSGVTNVTISLANVPANGNDYRFVTSVRPQGANWTGNIEVCGTDQVTISSGSKSSKPAEKNITSNILTKDHGIKLFPNPVKDQLFISGLTTGSELIIQNIMGQTVSKIIARNTEEVINTSLFVTGLYIVSIDGTSNYQLIKN